MDDRKITAFVVMTRAALYPFITKWGNVRPMVTLLAKNILENWCNLQLFLPLQRQIDINFE